MLQRVLIILLASSVVGCSSLMGSATTRLANNLSAAILNQNDPETVRVGAPAYLLLIDGLIEEEGNNVDKLLTGSQLYGAYASTFVEDERRAQKLATKSFDYAQRALCLHRQSLCNMHQLPFDAFNPVLTTTINDDVAVLFAFGSAWSSWVQINSGDWNAIADLPKITALMKQVVKLQDGFKNGEPHLYLAMLSSQLPANLGGKPEQARAHFKRAIELSQGRNLMIKVLYARQYARMLYKRDLHDALLNEVLSADPNASGLTLMNTLAQQQAQQLLDSADEYF